MAFSPEAPAPAPNKPDMAAQPLAADTITAAARAALPADFVLVEEAPSIMAELQDQFRIDRPDCFYSFASGGEPTVRIYLDLLTDATT